MTQGLDNAAKFTGDDVVAFTLDPFHDHRNAFFFATNPNGAEFDALVTDESPTLNVDWRAVWRVAARRVPEGWSAEFAIPFRSLRYPRAEGEQAWGFDVERIVRRRNEDTLWSAWTRAEGGLNRVSRAGHLEGLGGLPAHGRRTSSSGRSASAALTRAPGADGAPADDARGAGGRGPQVGGAARPRPRRDGAARLRPGRGRRPDREPHALRGLLPREARLLPRERRASSTSARAARTRRRPSSCSSRAASGSSATPRCPSSAACACRAAPGGRRSACSTSLTDEAAGAPRTNFGVVRLKRDVGARSYVGGMVTDRRTSSRRPDRLRRRRLALGHLPPQPPGLRRAHDAQRRRRATGRCAAPRSTRPTPSTSTASTCGSGRRAETGDGLRDPDRRAAREREGAVHVPAAPCPGLRSVAVYVGGKHQTHVDGAPPRRERVRRRLVRPALRRRPERHPRARLDRPRLGLRRRRPHPGPARPLRPRRHRGDPLHAAATGRSRRSRAPRSSGSGTARSTP